MFLFPRTLEGIKFGDLENFKRDLHGPIWSFCLGGMGPVDFVRWKAILMEPWWFIRAPTWSWSTLVPLPKVAQKTGFFQEYYSPENHNRPPEKFWVGRRSFRFEMVPKKVNFRGRQLDWLLPQKIPWELGPNCLGNTLFRWQYDGRPGGVHGLWSTGSNHHKGDIRDFKVSLPWRLMFIENVWELTHLQKNAGLFLPFLEARWCVFLFTWWDSWKYLRLQIETEAFGMKSPACEGVYPWVIFFMGYNAWTHNLQKQWRSWFLQPWARTF